MAEEMRTCKVYAAEIKPLEKGFNAVPRKEGGLLLQIVQNLPQQGSPAKARGKTRGGMPAR
ncbi:hypothetical protein [Neisseria gonorrhoeae]|uniref:hypothetical protein n=1 Tax=Neisseria gonorrhoeae TaxID=485 RepID=UPI001F0C2F2F|nr:hypothetical protein [Neisseria gonorrhoeae]